MAPSELLAHRVSHHMQGPFCLCSLVKNSSTAHAAPNASVNDAHPRVISTSAAIHIALEGEAIGEYVAVCANSRCDYFGEAIEHFKTFLSLA